MTTEGETAASASASGTASTEVVENKPSVKQTKVVLLTGFGGPKYVRVQSKDQRSVGKGEIAIDVEAW